MNRCILEGATLFLSRANLLIDNSISIVDLDSICLLVVSSLVGSAIVVIGLYILLWGKNKEIMQNSGVAKGDPEIEKAKIQDPESHPTTVTCDSKDPPAPAC